MKNIRVKAPGRINIIGEHTDYNDGFVLPAAIDRYIEFELYTDSSTHISTVTAIDKGERLKFLVQDDDDLYGTWGNYIQGIVRVLKKLRPGQIKNFNGSFTGSIPHGSGLSSSAALEIGLAVGLNTLFDLGLSKMELIRAAQLAEHQYVGTQCGIMDQFASMMGKLNHAVLLDCKTLDFDYVKVALEDYKFVIINSNIQHELAFSAYNQRRDECNEGVEIIGKYEKGITSLREVSPAMLALHQHSFPPLIFNRCAHVVNENQRVIQFIEAVEENNLKAMGEKIKESHQSLRNLYEVSCPEVDFLVDQVIKLQGIFGARMMGGGFGGCILGLVTKDFSTESINPVLAAYENKFGITADIIPFTIADGAQVIY